MSTGSARVTRTRRRPRCSTSSKAVIYGVVGYPGLAKVDLSIGTIGSFASGKALPSPRVQVVNGVSFYIGVLPDSACAYRSLEVKTTSPCVSAEHNLGFATAGAGQGTFIADNPGNSGGCVANRIDPISFSQGIWQLIRASTQTTPPLTDSPSAC